MLKHGPRKDQISFKTVRNFLSALYLLEFNIILNNQIRPELFYIFSQIFKMIIQIATQKLIHLKTVADTKPFKPKVPEVQPKRIEITSA
jgi:hypothetical protein